MSMCNALPKIKIGAVNADGWQERSQSPLRVNLRFDFRYVVITGARSMSSARGHSNDSFISSSKISWAGVSSVFLRAAWRRESEIFFGFLTTPTAEMT
jgi:hypothetical protein